MHVSIALAWTRLCVIHMHPIMHIHTYTQSRIYTHIPNHAYTQIYPIMHIHTYTHLSILSSWRLWFSRTLYSSLFSFTISLFVALVAFPSSLISILRAKTTHSMSESAVARDACIFVCVYICLCVCVCVHISAFSQLVDMNDILRETITHSMSESAVVEVCVCVFSSLFQARW